MAHHADPAPYWTRRDHSPKVGEVDAAVTMLGGWYDVFLPWQLKDYAALRAAGRRPYLTIGPWYHIDARHIGPSMAESLAWFRAHLLGDVSGLRDQPVRLYVTGGPRNGASTRTGRCPACGGGAGTCSTASGWARTGRWSRSRTGSATTRTIRRR
ncbi:CocE/NonD family hydrolase [Nonomuraea ferruginea]